MAYLCTISQSIHKYQKKKGKMLLSPSQFVCSPSKFSSKYSEKIFPNNHKSKSLRIENSTGKMNKFNKYACGIPCRTLYHPLELEFPLLDDEFTGGIGIDTFFEGKNIFITGATGLVGKAFVEKLLRSTSVDKIYLLMKANDKEAAFQRLHDDIINSELFKRLRDEYGSSYEAFVSGKLVPVFGNICEPNLGMDSVSTRALMEEVDVVINSAASTTMHQRYDVLLEENVNAPQRLMRFAKTCKNLRLFVQISTAYVHGRREGLIMEKPLIMGENRRKEEAITSDFALTSRLDVNDEINLAMKVCKSSKATDVTVDLKKLGLERAAFYGWYNTYHLTKAMAEMVLNEIRGDVPLLVIRPTAIESTYNEPFPGWIQGNRVFDPLISTYGKGNLPAYLCDPEVQIDIVPVDMVVNTTIAAIAKHGTVNKPDVIVYHAATGHINSLQFFEFFEFLHEYFTLSPITGNSESIKKVKFFNEFADFSKFMREEMSSQPSRVKTNNLANDTTERKFGKHFKAKVAYAENLCKIYEFAGFMNARFDTRNTRKLLEEMSEDEKMKFEVDATKIDWRKYFTEIHIPGLIKHVLHGAKMHD